MELKRKIYERLIEWKDNISDKCALKVGICRRNDSLHVEYAEKLLCM